MTVAARDVAAIEADLREPVAAVLARSIVGTADPGELAERIDAFCRTRAGAALVRCFFCRFSVGGAFGLELADGGSVVLKAYPPNRPRDFVEAATRAQRHLAACGFPCPRPLVEPAPFGEGFGVLEEFLDVGAEPDPHEPAVRREMARTLAWLVELAEPFHDVEALASGFSTYGENDLWPAPHNVLFDFDATGAGAEWIDRLALEARTIVDAAAARRVVGHGDWSAKHFRFENGIVRVVYDWDSLKLEKETVLVGGAAATFTDRDDQVSPTLEQSLAFVDDYEAARGSVFSPAERRAVGAAITYALAYTSRCEHAVDPSGAALAGSYREKLASVRDSLLG